MKQILYIDMDGVIANFDKAIRGHCPELDTYGEESSKKVDEICEANTEIFHTLEPIEGALAAINLLANYYDIYFLSTPMWNVPASFGGKRVWLETHLGDYAFKRLILTHRKDLNVGDFLVDDRKANGAGEFLGEHIHFGTDKFPDWEAVTRYLTDLYHYFYVKQELKDVLHTTAGPLQRGGSQEAS